MLTNPRRKNITTLRITHKTLGTGLILRYKLSTQDRDMWLAVVIAVMKLRLP